MWRLNDIHSINPTLYGERTTDVPFCLILYFRACTVSSQSMFSVANRNGKQVGVSCGIEPGSCRSECREGAQYSA